MKKALDLKSAELLNKVPSTGIVQRASLTGCLRPT